MNIGIIGCGLIGNKRALSIGANDNIISVCDVHINKPKSLSKNFIKKSNQKIIKFWIV